MRYFFIIACLVSSVVLYGDSAQDDYESINDNAKDCQQEHELGEFDYPEIVQYYKNNRDTSLMAMEILMVKR